ncbi:hypothetical protein FRC03_007202 [Tulasnella sp. 419]|nr:hypothetical protein FRC03_007202 [Tulasnella sp. 419]
MDVNRDNQVDSLAFRHHIGQPPEPLHDPSFDDSAPLLGGPRKVEREGKAALTSGIGNLLNTIVGTGMLSFPMAMASAGIIPGILTCLLSGTVASFGLYLLSVCATQTHHRRSSFFAVSKLTFPGAAVWFDAAIAIKCFGVSISYLIIIKGLAPNVVKTLAHILSPETVLPAWTLDGRVWITLFMIVLIPLCFLKTLDSLRHTSYVALFSVAYLVIVVIVCYFFPPKGSSPPGEIHLIKFTGSFVSTFPVQVFAFTCAQNLFPIYNELYHNTQERMNIVIGSSIGSATIIYEIISVFGYLTFGSKVGPNIIAMYPSTTLFVAIGQFAIVILVMFSYPLQVHPCRNCLDKVFARQPKQPPSPPNREIEDDEEDDTAMDDGHGGAPHEMSLWKHSVLTSAIVVGGFSIAYFVNDLQMGQCFLLYPSSSGNPTSKSSAVICGVHRIYDDIVYTSRSILLQSTSSHTPPLLTPP